LTSSQIVTLIDDSVKSGRWDKIEDFSFYFSDTSDWDRECVPFIKEVVKEMAIRKVLPSYSVSGAYPSISTGFNHTKENKVASINNQLSIVLPEPQEVYVVKIKDYNSKDVYGTCLYLTFEEKTGRPAPITSAINPRLGTKLNVGFPDLYK